MKIEIEIDIEAIVREEVRKYIHDNLMIKNITNQEAIMDEVNKGLFSDIVIIDENKKGTVTISAPTLTEHDIATSILEDDSEEEFTGEYGPDKWQRRDEIKKAFHEAEMEKGDYLTPEEKGAIEAQFELKDEKQEKAKEEAKRKAEYEEKAKQITEELKQEEEQESSVPKADDLDNVASLFS